MLIQYKIFEYKEEMGDSYDNVVWSLIRSDAFRYDVFSTMEDALRALQERGYYGTSYTILQCIRR